MKNMNLKGIIVLILAVSAFTHTFLNAGEVTVVDEKFADGDFSKSPAWSAINSIHWFNPFYIAGFDNKQWIGAKRLGSIGTPFKNPEQKGWELTLDAQREPITISFLVRFEAISDKNCLIVYILGKDCRFLFRFTATGSGLIRWVAHPKEREPIKTLGIPLAEFKKGIPVKIDIKYGGKFGVTIARDGKNIYKLPKKDYSLISKFGSKFNLLAFYSSPSRGEKNIFLMKPSTQSERALFWITDISVRGTPGIVKAKPQADLLAPEKTAILFCGPGFLLGGGIEGLEKAGWKLDVVYGHQPLAGTELAKLKSKLTAKELRLHSWVVLYDIGGKTLGWDSCLELKEYVRSGGKLLILGGAQTLGRGGYFSSPLAECLPVSGKDSPDSLCKISNNKHYTYISNARKKDNAKVIDSGLPVYEMRYGKGKVRVVTWAILGNPGQAFWQNKTWLEKVLRK